MNHQTSTNGSKQDLLSSRGHALAALMDGRYSLAIRRYSSHLKLYPDDDLASLEMACAQAAGGKPELAKRTLGQLAVDRRPGSGEARVRTAQAYLKLTTDPGADVEDELQSAARSDPSFALAYLSLGRHLLWRKRDATRARPFFVKASELAPESQASLMGVLAADIEADRTSEAARGSLALLRRFPCSLKTWLFVLLSTVFASPLRGRLVILALSAALFIRVVGPWVLMGTAIAAVIGFVSLRRASPRLAVFPLLALLPLVVAYLARTIVLASVYP